jgi:hypothetical protein
MYEVRKIQNYALGGRMRFLLLCATLAVGMGVSGLAYADGSGREYDVDQLPDGYEEVPDQETQQPVDQGYVDQNDDYDNSYSERHVRRERRHRRRVDYGCQSFQCAPDILPGTYTSFCSAIGSPRHWRIVVEGGGPIVAEGGGLAAREEAIGWALYGARVCTQVTRRF